VVLEKIWAAKLMLDTRKTALKGVFAHSSLSYPAHGQKRAEFVKARPRDASFGEKKTTRKSSLLSSKFFTTLSNSGDSVDEAGQP
jgi:hypothetical protein